MIENLRNRQVPVPVVYFHFEPQDVRELSLNDMMRILLKQILSQMNHIPVCLEKFMWKPSEPMPSDLPTLVNLFVESAKELLSLAVVLDGFDEWDLFMRENLINSVVRPCYRSGIRICITTQTWLRDDLQIVAPETIPALQISADPRDVEDYIQANLRRKFINEELRTEIIRTISSGVGEM